MTEKLTEAQKAELRSEARFVTTLLEDAQSVCRRMSHKDPIGAFSEAEWHIGEAISELGME